MNALTRLLIPEAPTVPDAELFARLEVAHRIGDRAAFRRNLTALCADEWTRLEVARVAFETLGLALSPAPE